MTEDATPLTIPDIKPPITVEPEPEPPKPIEPHTASTVIEPLLGDKALAFVRGACYSYLPAVIHQRWGQGIHGLRFTEHGMARAGQIFGWITGLSSCTEEAIQKFAAKCAIDICREFDGLACYGGHHVDPATSASGHDYTIKTPRYIVELNDDGTFGGFTVLWLVAVHPSVHEAMTDDAKWVKKYDEICRYGVGPRYRYTRSMNGGLLFHGPGGSKDLFAVRLDGGDHLWSIHT